MGIIVGLKEEVFRGLEDAVTVLARDLREKGEDISKGISLFGLDPVRLTRISVNLGSELGVRVYIQSISGTIEVDAGDYLLKGNAWKVSQLFYDERNSSREMIVVEGKPTSQRERFMYYLRNEVDVFVEPEEQYSTGDREGVFVTSFFDF